MRRAQESRDIQAADCADSTDTQRDAIEWDFLDEDDDSFPEPGDFWWEDE